MLLLSEVGVVSLDASVEMIFPLFLILWLIKVFSHFHVVTFFWKTCWGRYLYCWKFFRRFPHSLTAVSAFSCYFIFLLSCKNPASTFQCLCNSSCVYGDTDVNSLLNLTWYCGNTNPILEFKTRPLSKHILETCPSIFQVLTLGSIYLLTFLIAGDPLKHMWDSQNDENHPVLEAHLC